MTNIQEQNKVINEAESLINICHDRHLSILDLSDIELTAIPEEVKKLKYLEVLKLSENSISELPDFLCSLDKLEYIDLSYNKLSILPQSISRLTCLKKLNFKCNNLREIPESIGELNSLRSLDISYNQLSELPETINNLPNLENCIIKGNNISRLSEKIIALTTKQKELNLLGHVEQIVKLTEKNDLSENSILSAMTHIKHITQKLNISQIQAVLFSHIVSEFETTPVELREIARSLDCSKLKLMQYMSDFEELEQKKLIRISPKSNRRRFGFSASDVASYSIPKEVMVSLMKNEEYKPVSQSNLSNTELFVRMHSLFEECCQDRISYNELSTRINELLKENMHLIFVKKIFGYELSQEDFLLLLRFCHLYINCDRDELDFNTISAIYEQDSDFGISRRQFKLGEHILMIRGFVEFANSNGFGNRELFKLTTNIKNDLLSELKIKSSRNHKDIIRASTIHTKELFYNAKERTQVEQLISLLNDSAYKEIKTRLSDSGMRTGFACLFSGQAGTGKTETVYQIAKQTGRDILAVDISETKSMWFGESEKKIKEIFTRYRDYVEEAEITPILLFNEADAVFGKRKDISRSNLAQTENAIQNIILQEMENLNGILIATTNMTMNFDKAFERRFLYKIEFGKPDIESKKMIWKSQLPALADNDAIQLAKQFDFSGGQIENISRKSMVSFILRGAVPCLSDLKTFCEEELLEKPETRIGFLT
ncbi:MAG: AAA family ATPase [Spirochaetaceae bacterium]|nr:AAA family ATPase [Spirochaetaceae bacterium]